MDAAYDRLPLNALRVFEAVATRLNFADAAEALHVTPAAVSQQVKSLEDYLQTPLFRRRGRTVELTSEGADLLPRVRRGLDELEAALQQSREQRESGVLNVSMLASFLQKWLTPRSVAHSSAAWASASASSAVNGCFSSMVARKRWKTPWGSRSRIWARPKVFWP